MNTLSIILTFVSFPLILFVVLFISIKKGWLKLSFSFSRLFPDKFYILLPFIIISIVFFVSLFFDIIFIIPFFINLFFVIILFLL